jgi:hypothetical protein
MKKSHDGFDFVISPQLPQEQGFQPCLSQELWNLIWIQGKLLNLAANNHV